MAPLYGRRNQGTARLSYLLRVTQLLSGKSGSSPAAWFLLKRQLGHRRAHRTRCFWGWGGVLSNEGCGRTGIQPFQTNAWTLMQRLYKGPSPVSPVWEAAWRHRYNTGPNQSEKAGCPGTWLDCMEKTHCPAPPSWAVVPISEL